MTTDILRVRYFECIGRANRLREAITTQIAELLNHAQITLGVPMESRVKSWVSIEEKLQRKHLSLDRVEDLDDFIGVRLILLFRSDLAVVGELLSNTFDVIGSEDTAARLGEMQFGYQSRHYVIRLPKTWLAIPSMTDLGDLRVEVQVRTLAQHIWAAASHKLQYKHEESVPPPLRRTIHRVSALLETVDLEFDRVLEERRNYRKIDIPVVNAAEHLNVDLLASVLAEFFPPANRMQEERYAELLTEMNQLSIRTVAELRALLEKHRDAVMQSDHNLVMQRRKAKDYTGTTEERIKSGVYFAHMGLAREVLRREFGKKAESIIRRHRRAR